MSRPEGTRRITGWKLWCFRIVVPVLVPVLIFGGLEIGLRAFGYGYPTSAILEYDLDGDTCYGRNLKFGWRFFPESLAREPDVFVIPAKKNPGTCRIFVLGGSAALGTPAAAYGFSRILQVMLEERYPGARFEVINMAMTAINSHVVLPIARDCARHEPDLFVVYLGNNEVVGPYGVGTVFSPLSPSLWAIRAGLALKTTRMGQLVADTAAAFAPERELPDEWQGMRLFLENQVPFDEPALEHVYDHFERNLEEICATGIRAGAVVVLCTVASNLRECPPFASRHRRDLEEADLAEWERHYASGVAEEEAGRHAEALGHYMAAARIDDHFADLLFRTARCLWLTGDRDTAGKRYALARDRDTLRFRADTRINAAIRAVAESAEGNVILVDGIAAAAAATEGGVPGRDLFFDHVHYNFRGNHRLAAAVLERIGDSLPKRVRAGKKAGPALAEEECAHRLACTGWDRHRVMEFVVAGFVKKAPFTNQLYHGEHEAEADAALAALRVYAGRQGLLESRGMYEAALKLRPQDWKLRSRFAIFLLEGMKDINSATDQFRKVTELVPDYGAQAKLGGLLAARGRLDEAMLCFERVLELKPGYARGLAGLARVLAQKGDLEAAAAHYARALENDPGLPQSVHREYESVRRKLEAGR